MFLLKAVGLILFIWLILKIDRSALLKQLSNANPSLLGLSFVIMLVSYFLQVVRWHFLLKTAGLSSGFGYSWAIYNIGTFLGMITPAKAGELGKGGYLHKKGVSPKTSIILMLSERSFDAAVVAALATLAVGILFGLKWSVIVLLSGLVFLPFGLWGAVIIWRLNNKHQWDNFLEKLLSQPLLIFKLLLLTAVSWSVYCLWPLMLALSLGLNPPVIPFIAAVILAGVVAVLPLAPSGLGTRDATLVWLLAPMGIAAERALAVSFLMFVSIVLSSFIGVWYWLRGVKH